MRISSACSPIYQLDRIVVGRARVQGFASIVRPDGPHAKADNPILCGPLRRPLFVSLGFKIGALSISGGQAGVRRQTILETRENSAASAPYRKERPAPHFRHRGFASQAAAEAVG